MTRGKVFKKVFSLIASGAMTFAMALPVFAEDGGKTTEAWISKTYNTEAGKAETFSFTATQNTAGEDLVKTDANISISDIPFDGTNTGSTTKRSQIIFPNYTEAGHYQYTVTENQTANSSVTDGEHEKLIMSKAEYTVDVYVENADGNNYVISNIIVNKVKDDKGSAATGKVTDIGNTEANDFRFTNTYVQEAGTGDNPGAPGDDYTNYGSFSVSKTVNANGGAVDTNKEFDFKATFTFPAGTDATTLGGVKENETVISLEGDGSYSFKLKDKESMKFTGLPVGTTVSVTETGTPNYKGSFALTLDNQNSITGAGAKYGETFTISNGKLGKAKNTADVTNTYNYVPTTGIIMNSLPYITMIGIGMAALGLYIASKHRKISD